MLPLHQRLRLVPQIGVVRWIGVRPQHGAIVQPQDEVTALTDEGGFQAARGHGGITARVERGGLIRLGDEIRVLDDEPDPPP